MVHARRGLRMSRTPRLRLLSLANLRRWDLQLKLQAHLAETPGTEKDAVYLLVLARKALELLGKKRQFPSLSLFCDWVLHIRIDRHHAGFSIIQELDKEMNELLDPSLSWRTGSAFRSHRKIAKLWTLRGDLRRFLRVLGIRAPRLFDKGQWVTFQRLVLNALADSPLSMDETKLKVVRALYFSVKNYGGWPTRSQLLRDAPYPNCYVLLRDGMEYPLGSGLVFGGRPIR